MLPSNHHCPSLSYLAFLLPLSLHPEQMGRSVCLFEKVWRMETQSGRFSFFCRMPHKSESVSYNNTLFFSNRGPHVVALSLIPSKYVLLPLPLSTYKTLPFTQIITSPPPVLLWTILTLINVLLTIQIDYVFLYSHKPCIVTHAARTVFPAPSTQSRQHCASPFLKN